MDTIAIKPGSTYTSIYVSGQGLVLKEPSVVAFDLKSKKKLRAVGCEAIAMRDSAPDVTVLSPMNEGIISEPELYTLMLKEFLNKICPLEALFRPRYEAVVGVPIGLSVDEREMYENVMIEAGIIGVTLVPNIILSAIGADLPVSTGKGMLAVNIGGGRSEIALLSGCGILNGCGVSIGGDAMDKAIIQFAANEYNMKISRESARKIREEIGTLYENDIASMVVSGIDISSNVLENASIPAYEIREVILPYYLRICELIKTTIKFCPANLVRDIMNGDIAITGGASKVPGIKSLFMQQLSLPVQTFDHPEYLQISGAARLLNNDELMQKLIGGGSV